MLIINKLTFATCLVVTLVSGFGATQETNDLDLDDVKNKLSNHIPELGSFNESALPSPEQVEESLKEKCKKNGADPTIIDNLKEQQTIIKNCMENYVNTTVLRDELEKAKETGSMDVVFGKYCAKYGDVRKCFSTATENITMCLNEKEKEAYNSSIKAIAELKEFLCYRDGDRMAMFVAEGGVECVTEKEENIKYCLNQTLGSRVPDNLNVDNLPLLVFTESECKDFEKMRVCINKELEQCKTNTPANLVDAFFRYLKKHTPCNSTSTLELQATSDAYSAVASFAMVLGIFVVFVF